jgi:hypothetical protein
MILLIVITEMNERTHKREQIFSHGINLETGQTIVLPCEHPIRLGGVFDPDLGEYVIHDNLLASVADARPRNRRAFHRFGAP